MQISFDEEVVDFILLLLYSMPEIKDESVLLLATAGVCLGQYYICAVVKTGDMKLQKVAKSRSGVVFRRIRYLYRSI